MVKKDLERIGIPYETPEGIADFHTAGRHSHITALVRNGATLVEAKELARQADLRQTMKYAHIGLEDQAQAFTGLPSPLASAVTTGLQFGCISCGALSQEVSPSDTPTSEVARTLNEQSPAKAGLASPVVTICRQLTVRSEVEAAGIAPACLLTDLQRAYALMDTRAVGCRK